jgi:hypothetical protein
LHATPDDLKKDINEHTRNLFKIKVPPIPEEFPELSAKKTKIYPLPISHENQCKTFGLGRNLYIFAEEFDFTSGKKKEFLPIVKGKKHFTLQLAYKRYAFLKGMEKHKKEQKEYEEFLRNNGTHACI